MSSDNGRVEKVLREYLERHLEGNKLEGAWTVASSPISGRGLRASRDLQPGDVVFWDHPVVLGPRLVGNPICVGCHLESDALEQCPKGCKLPVCSSRCVKSRLHQKECTILSANGSCTSDDSWSTELLRSLTALRCLEIPESDKKVVQCLQANRRSNELEVEILKKAMGDKLDAENEEWMRSCCRSMNTNAFETMKRITAEGKQREGTLRGLYPLGAFMNHECSPNTRHVFDENFCMLVEASRFIAAGEEFTTSYCPLLWDTSSRRLHLVKTKQFACNCERCKDPTEFGTFLSGLPCPDSTCSGVILSSNPLIPHRTNWICKKCLSNVSVEKVMQLQKTEGLLLMGTDSSNPESTMNFLELRRSPHNSVVEIQLKLGLCFQLGHVESFKWEDLTDERLGFKKQICQDILDILQKLRLGECRLRGMLAFELYSTLSEQLRRLLKKGNSESEENTNSIRELMEETLKAASDILAKDATAPKEFREKFNKEKKSIKKK